VILVNELFLIVYKQFQGLKVFFLNHECGTNIFGASHLAPTINDIIVIFEVCDAV